MVGLVLLSLPFALIAAWSGRKWTLVLPIVFWIGLAELESLGILPGTTGAGSAVLAGIFGSVFAAVGLSGHDRLRRPAV